MMLWLYMTKLIPLFTVVKLLQQNHIDPMTGKIRNEIWATYPNATQSLVSQLGDSDIRIYTQHRPGPIPILKHNKFS